MTSPLSLARKGLVHQGTNEFGNKKEWGQATVEIVNGMKHNSVGRCPGEWCSVISLYSEVYKDSREQEG